MNICENHNYFLSYVYVITSKTYYSIITGIRPPFLPQNKTLTEDNDKQPMFLSTTEIYGAFIQIAVREKKYSQVVPSALR